MPEHPDRLPLIILEFELEKDDINPLYPPDPDSPLLGSPDPTTTESSLDSHTPSSRTDSDVSAQSAGGAGALLEIRGLSDDHEWKPSPQDVLESTTSRSKPLKAFQRLRKLDALQSPANGRSAAGSDESPSSARRKRRAGQCDSAGGVGMMDVFAVMSQVNKQFGNAPDLETFLNVVVGVVKELTQFHRVLVYQFDEVWNGFVAAELVDWSKTHDLFKGLHFPASDIPPQASAPNHTLVDQADGDCILGS